MAYSSKMAPGESITYTESWLSKQASEPIKFLDGMVRAIFDNEQKIGKTRKIGKEKKLPMSVITSSAMIELDPDNLVQNNAAVSPKLWLFLDMAVEEKMNAITRNSNLRDENYFRSRRNNLIRQRLSIVKCQFNIQHDDVIDEIISNKKKISNIKICNDCSAENCFSHRICKACHVTKKIYQNFNLSLITASLHQTRQTL